MEPIDETLKKIAADTSQGNIRNTLSTEPAASHDWQGDPNCPLCGGVGYIRQDLPINHPDFGKLQICTCRQKTVAQMAHERLYRLSNLEAFKHFSFDNFSTQGRTGLGEEQISSLTSAHHTSGNLPRR